MKQPILKLLRQKVKQAKQEGHNKIIVFSNPQALEIYNRVEGKIDADVFNELIDAESPIYTMSLKRAYLGGCETIRESLFNSRKCLLRKKLVELEMDKVLIDFDDVEE